MIKKYWEKHATKKLLPKKSHVRFILHFILAAEGYICGNGIILLYEWLFSLSFWIVGTNFYLIPEKFAFFVRNYLISEKLADK